LAPIQSKIDRLEKSVETILETVQIIAGAAKNADTKNVDKSIKETDKLVNELFKERETLQQFRPSAETNTSAPQAKPKSNLRLSKRPAGKKPLEKTDRFEKHSNFLPNNQLNQH
jgi:hypothetical protein